jgi:hypothetical protein
VTRVPLLSDGHVDSGSWRCEGLPGILDNGIRLTETAHPVSTGTRLASSLGGLDAFSIDDQSTPLASSSWKEPLCAIRPLSMTMMRSQSFKYCSWCVTSSLVLPFKAPYERNLVNVQTLQQPRSSHSPRCSVSKATDQHVHLSRQSVFMLRSFKRTGTGTRIPTADSGSSRRTMSVSEYTTRASAIRAFWPPDKLIPRSPISVESRAGSYTKHTAGSMAKPGHARNCTWKHPPHPSQVQEHRLTTRIGTDPGLIQHQRGHFHAG